MVGYLYEGLILTRLYHNKPMWGEVMTLPAQLMGGLQFDPICASKKAGRMPTSAQVIPN